ncbi:NAD-dependent epimerase/dehydratase family protein [Ralstonia chuxiongensis]|uniref:NAD-dependent epimerase/dehydratase family protein n=1 Tax=Ralstonia chuxiongensis TaxID=2957504 RepID=A0AA41WTM1_9RALS|nr:NAD-dependent epimerase/dehydratase family protein [Ralstonia chuxiongensis]MCP1172628.1 NAD-dependent epimerase/dehydratase family protein [Ralstonia chuxiongensis]
MKSDLVLITGASGFVGKAVLATARARGISVRPVFRTAESASDLGYSVDFKATDSSTSGLLPHDTVRDLPTSGDRATLVPTLESDTDWRSALSGVNVVIHCAARAHVTGALLEFRQINVGGTLRLAQQAAEVGVRRFIFVSSIGVHGNTTSSTSFKFNDQISPHSPYAKSKAEAEIELKRLAKKTGMEVTIIRPPLVYGPGAPGNIHRMVWALNRNIPLPLGCVTRNRRSLVMLDNLVDLLLICVDHPGAANQTFLVSDGEDLSTAELLRRLGAAIGYPAKLVHIPVSILRAAAYLLGKRHMAEQLLGSLQVDIEHTRHTLGWTPPISVDEGFRKMSEQRS